MSPESINIKLVFEKALYISYVSQSEPDSIQFTFADRSLFISEDGIMMELDDIKIKRSLMRQIPEDA